MNERYKNTPIDVNKTDEYKPLIEMRGLNFIEHYAMQGLKYPTQKEINDFTIQKEIWQKGSSLWKFAAQHYNNRGNLWWVIAQFNQKPTEQHFSIGDTVFIPLPLEKVLRSYGL